MNVLYLHMLFGTREGSGGTRSYEFAKALLARRHTVTMVMAPRQGGGVEHKPHQVIDGIDVLSVGGWYSNHLSRGQRIRQFLRFAWKAAMLRRLPHRPDVVIATSTPLTIGIPGAVLARRFGVPLVFEVRDLWPQAPIELGALRNPLLRWAARRLERWCYRRADRVIALSPGIQRGVLQAGADAAKVEMIPNASDIDLFDPARRDRKLLDRWGLAEKFVAVHGGSMGAANGLDYVVAAARELRDRGEHDIQLLLCGYGGTRERLERQCAEWQLENVTFTGLIVRREMEPIVSSCDVAVVSFADFPVLATNSPNKLFDGLAAGLPCIVNSPGWTRDMVLEHDAGLYVDVRDPGQLADALVQLRDDPAARKCLGSNARRLAETRYARSLLAAQFCDVLEQVACRAGGGRARAAIESDVGDRQPVTRS